MFERLYGRCIQAALSAIGSLSSIVSRVYETATWLIPSYVAELVHFDTETGMHKRLYSRNAIQSLFFSDGWSRAGVELSGSGFYIWRAFYDGDIHNIVMSAERAVAVFGSKPWLYSSSGIGHIIKHFQYHRDHSIVAIFVNGLDATKTLKPYLASLQEPSNITADATYMITAILNGAEVVSSKKEEDHSVTIVDFLLNEHKVVGSQLISEKE